MAPQDPDASTDNNGIALLVTVIVMLIISWLSVASRVYVRAVMTRSFQVDDWVMLAGLVRAIVLQLNLHILTSTLDRSTSQYHARSYSRDSPLASAGIIDHFPKLMRLKP
jgi:hypothetical protein